MKNNISPLTIDNLRVAVADATTEISAKYPAFDLFDQRRDHSVTYQNFSLAVCFLATNTRQLKNNSSAGINRPVSIAVINADSKKTLAGQTVWITIGRGTVSKPMRFDLPICADEISFDSAFTVIVTDELTRVTLAHKQIIFFDERDYTYPIASDWVVDGASVSPYCLTRRFRAIKSDPLVFNKVRFDLTRLNKYHVNEFPEMEIRIFFPDGSVKRSFCNVGFDDFDSCDMGKYHAEMRFEASEEAMGVCYAEVLCLEQVISGFVFSTDDEPDEGIWSGEQLGIMNDYSTESYALRYAELKSTLSENNDDKSLFSDTDFEEALENFISSQITADNDDLECSDNRELEVDSKTGSIGNTKEEVSFSSAISNLTGLKSVKEKLLAYEKLVIFNKKRAECNLPTLKLPLHAMFWGSPGTGKTTVAKRMGWMLRHVGVLSKGHVVIKERATLLGPNYSCEETNTLAAIEEAQGGILFIDEAYQLYQPNDPRDPGKFVIEALMTALADESNRDWMLILAGYTDEMKHMFEMNPGLKSRIPESNIYIFDDFTENELMEIAERYFVRNRYLMTEDAKTALSIRLGNDYRNRNRGFGNARHVINMIQTEILPSIASRVFDMENPDVEALSQILSCDIPKPQNLVQGSRPKIGYCA